VTRAPLHWEVCAVLASGAGNGRCRHEHATAAEATMCPWTPEPWPEVCDLLVRQVRTADGRRRAPRGRDRQLELFARAA
jgi:hypothetical protein